VASAENSTLNWRGAYGYIEDIRDGQGYTAGIIGFCSGTHDMLALVEN
jgi:chitosanase